MKKKLANLLRRWAYKLSPFGYTPDGRPLISVPGSRPQERKIKCFKAARHLSRFEIEALETDPDMAVVIAQQHIDQLIKDIARELYKSDAITIHSEPEGCTDSHDVLIAQVYAVINPPKV